MFVSVANRDKRHMIFPVKRLADLGFEILATSGTASVLKRNGVEATVIRKLHEEPDDGEARSTIVDKIRTQDIQLIINTPHGTTAGGSPRLDGYEIRTAAVAEGIPCITTVQGLGAAVQGIEALIEQRVEVASLQEWAEVVRKGRGRHELRLPRTGGDGRLRPGLCGHRPARRAARRLGLPDSVEGLERFAATCVEAFAGHVGFVKPQSAFFERFGSRGVAVLEGTIQDLRHTGTLVLLDVKRGDIGSTAAAYAEAYLDEDSPMCADAVTVSPFLGFGSLEPFFEVAEQQRRWRLRAGPHVQRRRPGGPAGRERRRHRGRPHPGASSRHSTATQAPMGPFGAVVGATIGSTGEDLAINGPLLAPGLGAQGGTVDDVVRLFGSVADHVLPSTSRGVLAAGPDVQALRDSAAQVNDELVRSLQMHRTSRSPQ